MNKYSINKLLRFQQIKSGETNPRFNYILENLLLSNAFFFCNTSHFCNSNPYDNGVYVLHLALQLQTLYPVVVVAYVLLVVVVVLKWAPFAPATVNRL